MGFGEAIASGFRNYAVWQGRAPRSEYWFFVLFVWLVSFAGVFFDLAAGTSRPGGFSPFQLLAIMVIVLPHIAVTVRRLHDLDRSGWWCWLGLIPIVGSIVLLVWFCQRGTVGGNRFGADPLGGWPGSEDGQHSLAG